MKRRFMIALLAVLFLTVGCAQMTKVEKKTYDEGLKYGKGEMDRWSYWSGYYTCGLGAAQVTWPVHLTEAGQLNNLLQNPTVMMGIAQLDQLTREAGKWKKDEYVIGCFQGTGARITLKTVLDMVKAFCPQCAAYTPVIQ